VGKYGTNLEGFGAFEGGVNADKGAPLVSTSSDGETALLFGPAALREIQAGVANGDFAIPPDDGDAVITAENPLPYWTFTDVNSAGAITCAIVNDPGAASTNVLRFTVASGTLTGKSATLTRYVPVASSASRSFSFYAEATFDNATSTTQANATLSCQFYKADQTTTTGTGFTSSTVLFSAMTTPNGLTAPTIFTALPNLQESTAPADAAYLKLTITISTVATQSAARTIDLTEVRLAHGLPEVIFTDRTFTSPPAYIAYDDATLRISEGTNNASIDFLSDGGASTIGISATATNGIYLGSGQLIQLDASTIQGYGDFITSGDIGVDGRIYFDSALTGPYIQQAGTNGRIISVASATSTDGVDLLASTASARSGILVTKATTGQPTTTLNGTGATDAFADVLRNGGIAVDSTNNRAYFYSGGWKYAALTTPSDSRLKEEITDITGALDTLRQLVPVAFKWKRPEAHGRSDAVADDGTRLGFIADQVATTDLAHWVETLGVDEREADLVDTTEVLAVNIPQNEMEALVVQALLDIDTRLKALESR
jgi:hypothetical protein